MNTRNLKALNESIESVMSHDEARDIVHNFIHSLTELASQTDGLEEGYQAKRMRLIRKYVKLGSKFPDRLKDFMQRSFKKKRQRGRVIEPGGSVKEIETRAGKRTAAMRAKGLKEEASLSEGMYKKLMRLKGKAYKSQGSPSYGKIKRGEAELEAKVAAQRARRGGASPEAVKGGGSTIGKRGRHTAKAARLADQRQRGLSRFHGRELGHEFGIIRGGGRAEDKAAKRETQQARAKFEKQSRTGDFALNSDSLKRALSWKYRNRNK